MRRSWLEAQLLKLLNEKSTRNKPILITGDPGIGKSTFVANLVRESEAKEGKDSKEAYVSVLAHHVCMADNLKSLNAGEFVRSVSEMLTQRVPAYAETVAKLKDGLNSQACAKIQCHHLSTVCCDRCRAARSTVFTVCSLTLWTSRLQPIRSVSHTAVVDIVLRCQLRVC